MFGKLHRAVAARAHVAIAVTGAPRTPMQWYRWIMLAVVLVNVVLLAPVLTSMDDVPGAVRIAAVLVLVILSYVWIRQYRNERLRLIFILADAAGLWLVSFAVGDPLAALGLLYPVVYYRSLYGSARQLAIAAVVYMAAHYGAVLVAIEPTIALSLSQIIIQVTGIPIGTAVIFMMAHTLRRQERSVARERRLNQLGLALGAANDPGQVRELVETALRDLVAALDPAAWVKVIGLSCTAEHHVGAPNDSACDADGRRLLHVPVPTPPAAPVALTARVKAACAGELLEPLRSLAVLSGLALERLDRIEQVRQSEARFRSLVLNAPDLISVLDASGTIVDETPAVYSTLGYGLEARIGRSAMDFIHPEDLPAAAHALLSLVSKPNAAQTLELRARHADGRWLWMSAHARNELENPAVRGLVVNYRDITALKHSTTQLLHQARHDELTGLGNRKFLLETLRDGIARCTITNAPLALLLLDLDGFKEVNDTLGHEAGDALLREIGPRLAGVAEGRGSVARLGGDEFAIVLPCADESAALDVAHLAIACLQVPFVFGEARLELSASIGIALFPQHSRDANALLRQSDVAMYAAKRDRTGAAIYQSAFDDHNRERLFLGAELREALVKGNMQLHYQPKVDLATGRVVGAEALVRWQHPTRGLISPDLFIPIAVRAGLMPKLTDFVFAAAVRQQQQWRGAGLDLKVAINFASSDIQDADLISRIERILQEQNAAAEGLIIEMTEDTLIRETGPASANIARLRRLGFEIAIDDFGTGYSSLARLSQLPVDELKIDRAFVAKIANEREGAVVRSIVDLARNLRLRVVAEGVEHTATWRLLEQLGCDQAQGYLFGRPVPAADFLSGDASPLAEWWHDSMPLAA
jgi:diguanylate cyclase (GGDEF)-like protein/PAS domain S-box-containing protein